MDAQSFGIQWIQHHASGVGGALKTEHQLLTLDESHVPQSDELIDASEGPCIAVPQHEAHHYLVSEVPTEEDIEQIAAENLIFMAHDGQVVSEIITATTDANGAVVVSASDGTPINIISQSAAMALHEAAVAAAAAEEEDETMAQQVQYTEEDYAETQMVTEEVITDDWVQHQGEERVEISAEQIIGSNAHVPLDHEVPLPTVQDEYTALRPYPCDFCSRRFRKKASLMNHMVAHQNDRPHLCKLCGSRFFRRTDLINHLKAHAETPDPEFDDVEFMHFVEQAAIDQQQQQLQQQHQHDDHYYDQDWNIQSVAASTSAKSSRKLNSSASGSAPRGRISRIKPKMENNYTIDESMRQANSEQELQQQQHEQQHIEYAECQELQGSEATVKLLQDTAEPLQQQPQHFPIIDESKPFVCQQCGLAFAREKALLAHAKNHRNDTHECNQCNEMFWDSASLQEHLKTHQFEDSNSEYEPGEAEESQSDDDSEAEYLYGEFYCGDCGMSFHRQDLLHRHAKQHVKREHDANHSNHNNSAGSSGSNKELQHCCSTCGESFAEALDLLAHAEIHARYPPFKCILCGECFFDETTIKRHLSSQHANEMTANSCILCGKQCRDRKALMKHAWDHSREKCHSCSKCGKNFHNKARLKRHMASHRDKSVMCDVCHAEFPDGRTLSNHRHSHSATASGKLFPCNECGKTFGSRSSQQIHVRIHTGERPYGCRFCWKAFADGGTLRKHERIHTGEKPYACSVCPRAFNQRVVLREHIRSHHSGLDSKRATYHCSVCGADLPTSGELIQHLIQHSDMNTALQRQPITGPRKYKRRRKLKPHEIERLRTEHKEHGGIVGSDIDLSDFDMDNVDDLLGLQESSNNNNSATSNTTNTTNTTINNTATNSSSKAKRRQAAVAPTAGSGAHTVAAISSSPTPDSCSPQASPTATSSPQRYKNVSTSGNNSDAWQSKLLHSSNNSNNADTYKSLLSNLENTLQCIDTLVVQSNSSSGGGAQYNGEHVVKAESATTAARVRSSNSKKSSTTSSTADKTLSRPRMIHTQRTRHGATTSTSNGGTGGGGSRRRPRTQITRTQHVTKVEEQPPQQLHHHHHIVDDYEIISPDMQPPTQISSSPMHGIKQEHNNNHHHHQTQQQRDLYDAHLLLEATALRKEVYERYNPSIVNDLEDILRSPDKSEKGRQRFSSECSTTQYLAEQSEEEQHLIKIEPTSPNIHDIVVGAGGGTVSARRNTPRAARRRAVANNRKYLDFDEEIEQLANGNKSSIKLTPKQLQSHDINADKSAYLTYDAFDVADAAAAADAAVATASVTAAATDTSNSSYAVIAEAAVIAAAPASSATQQQQQQQQVPPLRKQRYYECEMCSAEFPDRAQLLDHVPIHI